MTHSCDKWLLVVDYNLSRRSDVRALTRYAAQRHGLRAVLIRPNPTPEDRTIADAILDLDPLNPLFVDKALAALAPWQGLLAGGLVFSDNAVATGAQLLRRLGLRGDDPNLASAAFSKAVYRRQEAEHAAIIKPQGIHIPPHERLSSRAEAEAFAARCESGFVLKPSCEGNNRGVIFVRDPAEVDRAWDEVSPYLSGGIIAEGFIDFPREYSFDGIADLNFVTEKISAHGRYPVEIGQLLPARVDAHEKALIVRAGRIANLLVGQAHGPFHNEIKVNADGTQAAIIEPNRRPAGMKIWALAERVYHTCFNELWVESALGKALPSRLPDPIGQAASVMLGVPKDGRLRLGDMPQPEALAQNAIKLMGKNSGATIELFDIGWLAPARESYPAVPRDNGDFVALACVYTPDSALDLATWVKRFQSAWRFVLNDWMLDESTHPVLAPVAFQGWRSRAAASIF